MCFIRLVYSTSTIKQKVFVERSKVQIHSNFSFSMLKPLLPVTCVYLSICPSHLTIPIAKIMLELPLIHVSIWPFVYPKTTALISQVFPFKYLSVLACPSSFALSQTFNKFTSVFITIFPQIAPKSMRSVFYVLSSVYISIAEILESLALSYKMSLLLFLRFKLFQVATVDRVA